MNAPRGEAARVLAQVIDHLRGALRADEAAVLGLQLLVWAHLDLARQGDGLRDCLAQGVQGVLRSLTQLGSTDDVQGQAFRGAALAAQDADYLLAAVDAAQNLAEAGIFERFTPAEIAADLLQSGRLEGGISPEVIRLMTDLVDPSRDKSVYCPWESTGQFVGALLPRDAPLFVETPSASPLVSLLALFASGRIDISIGNPLSAPKALRGGHLQKFDAAVAAVPFGRSSAEDVASKDLYGRFPVRRASDIGLSVQHVLAHTNGRAAIIVPNSFLFATGKDRDVREYLVSQGVVEAVIALPPGVLTNFGGPCALLVLNSSKRCRNVCFVDATKPFFAKPQGRGRTAIENVDEILAVVNGRGGAGEAAAWDSLVQSVDTDEVRAGDCLLQVDRYVIDPEQRAMQRTLEAVETRALEDVVKILSPLPNKDRGDESPSAVAVHEVGAADLPPFGYIRAPGKPVSVKIGSRRAGGDADVFLRPFDVVLIVKGSIGKVGIVPQEVPAAGPGGWIAGQSAVVLRPVREGLDLKGLGLWLRSDLGQQVLISIKSGTTIPMVSLSSLRRLQVIAQSEVWSDLAGQVLDAEEDLQNQIDDLRFQQASISEELWAELLGPSDTKPVTSLEKKGARSP